MTDLDKIMAEHQHHHVSHLPDDYGDCCSCSQPGHGPCQVHELAERARDAEATVAAVEAFAQQKAISTRATGSEERPWLDLLAVLERAALAGDQEQPKPEPYRMKIGSPPAGRDRFA